jgi:hypothetical protein
VAHVIDGSTEANSELAVDSGLDSSACCVPCPSAVHTEALDPVSGHVTAFCMAGCPSPTCAL